MRSDRPVDAPHAIILFDGVCNLCNATVHFVIRRDPRERFRFAQLQGDAARRICAEHGLPVPASAEPDSIVVIVDGRALERSDAALAIAGGLRFPWPLLGALSIVPRPARDAVYRLVARNRYRWFGRRSACLVPTEEIRSRFLD